MRDIAGGGNRDGIKLSGVRRLSGRGLPDRALGKCAARGSIWSAVTMASFSSLSSSTRPVPIAANGVQAEGGSSRIAVRRCRFKNAGGRGVNLGGSTGADYFRPPRGSGRGAWLASSRIACLKARWHRSRSSVSPGAIVRRNTILRPKRWILRILQENTDAKMQRCRDGRFEHNLIAFRSDELRAATNVGANTDAGSFRFAPMSGSASTSRRRPRD